MSQLSLFSDSVMAATCVAYSAEPKRFGPFAGGFNVGDRVRVIGLTSWNKYVGESGTVVEFQGQLAGHRGTTVPIVLDCCTTGDGVYSLNSWRPFWPQDLQLEIA